MAEMAKTNDMQLADWLLLSMRNNVELCASCVLGDWAAVIVGPRTPAFGTTADKEVRLMNRNGKILSWNLGSPTGHPVTGVGIPSEGTMRIIVDKDLKLRLNWITGGTNSNGTPTLLLKKWLNEYETTAGDFHCGYATIGFMKDGVLKQNWIGKNGKMLLAHDVMTAYPFRYGFAKAEIEENDGRCLSVLVGTDGKILGGRKFADVHNFHCGWALVSDVIDNKALYNLINKEGKFMFDDWTAYCDEFSEPCGLAWTCGKGHPAIKWNCVDAYKSSAGHPSFVSDKWLNLKSATKFDEGELKRGDCRSMVECNIDAPYRYGFVDTDLHEVGFMGYYAAEPFYGNPYTTVKGRDGMNLIGRDGKPYFVGRDGWKSGPLNGIIFPNADCILAEFGKHTFRFDVHEFGKADISNIGVDHGDGYDIIPERMGYHRIMDRKGGKRAFLIDRGFIVSDANGRLHFICSADGKSRGDE